MSGGVTKDFLIKKKLFFFCYYFGFYEINFCFCSDNDEEKRIYFQL